MARGTHGDGGGKGFVNKPAHFPNDSEMRGKDRRLRRELPPSDGNPRQVMQARTVKSIGITPEGLRPSHTITGPTPRFGLDPNDGMGPS
jgi:hypothetical protein